jgi:hypothetical protein
MSCSKSVLIEIAWVVVFYTFMVVLLLWFVFFGDDGSSDWDEANSGDNSTIE